MKFPFNSLVLILPHQGGKEVSKHHRLQLWGSDLSGAGEGVSGSVEVLML